MSDVQNFSPQDLADAVHGDLSAFSRLQNQSHEDILRARDALGELIVTAEDARKVLAALLEHEIEPEQAQAWAFFVRHGYIGYWQSQPITDEARREAARPGSRLLALYQAVPAGHIGPIRAIDIQYDISAEDSIAEAIARLDDIGTEIDGEITGDEILELLCNLESTSDEGPEQ
jgi:hypothetical protein